MAESAGDPTYNVPPGTVLVGKYRVVREIGRGGMAAVYEAVNISLNRKVAVKVLASELTDSTIVTERFFREARAAAAIKSPYIVEIFDADRLEDGRPYICMELLEGESLYDRMTRVRIIDNDTTLQIIRDCARGLSKAHASGVVHRDLKPENVFLTLSDEGVEIAKLLDFGLAKFYAPVADDEKAIRLTREGAVFGTPAYMSPEQVKGVGTVDHRSDLWALGCLAYECLTGRPVWNVEQGVAMIFASVATSPLPVPSSVQPTIPPGFDAWFARALAREPDERFQTASELADALARAFGKTNISLIGSGETPVLSLPPPERSFSARPPLFTHEATSSDAHPAENGKASTLRLVFSSALLVATTSIATMVGTKVFWPQVHVPTVVSTTATQAVPVDSATAAAGDPTRAPWRKKIDEGARLFVADPARATALFKQAQELGGNSVAKTYLEMLKFSAAQKESCRVLSFGHPRTEATSYASSPSLTHIKSGVLVVWTDAYGKPGNDHVFGSVLDEKAMPLGKLNDYSPEISDAFLPSLVGVSDGAALFFLSRRGSEAGVVARSIDGDGFASGALGTVGKARPNSTQTALSVAAGPDGFWASWTEEQKATSDIFMRRTDSKLVPVGEDIRVSDYATQKNFFARSPSMASASNSLFLVYRLDHDRDRNVVRMKIPLSVAKGLDEKNTSRSRRTTLEPVIPLAPSERAPMDSPRIGCGTEGCFAVWRAEKGGTFAALIEPKQGNIVWFKRLSDKSSFATIATDSAGVVRVAYYDAGKNGEKQLKLATLTRSAVVKQDGAVARVTLDPAPPALIPGTAKGEWWVSWVDREAEHTEILVAKIGCSQ